MSATPKTVLLVEDNEDNLVVYRTILEHYGYRVVEARDGEEGVMQAQQSRITRSRGGHGAIPSLARQIQLRARGWHAPLIHELTATPWLRVRNSLLHLRTGRLCP